MTAKNFIENQVVTFGCRLNTYESEVIKANLDKSGIDNSIVFNTCAVTNEASRQARQAIRKAKKANPTARIIVTGCGAQVETDTYAAMPEVDLLLGNDEKMHAKSYQAIDFGLSREERLKVNDIMSVKETAGHLIQGMSEHTRAFVQVQNGCDHRCTFCIIPFGRGVSRSVAAGEVINQIKILVGNGYKEIVLTGVDITSYGSDLPNQPPLGNLVQRILKMVPDLPRLRISSIDSVEADAELMDALSDLRLMPSLHLSLQHGDDMILKRMKRRHLRDDAVKFCEDARKIRPDIVLGADLIAGFPTETDAMFANSLSLIDDCGLTNLHIFPFSARQGTPAARMPQLDGGIIKQRAQQLRHKAKQALNRHLQSEQNCIRHILVEKNNKGRTEHFTAVTLDNEHQAGHIIKAKIIGKTDTELRATVWREGDV
ncbi:MAG: tRNA (N(6)-L-threonylcarbamoyladenosine(37)-C(2))-methylthiotransferase MtaB [Hyphomicrobiales bacterium]|nr:tRNA (N(6)-L-threonylcarbamoyladenosine(37)-C(2))-methylthiotransferase MtaB [Hyphomicrobiales bacterium]